MTGGHRRILVVEDDPETAGQLVDSFATSGYQVDLATNGNEALNRGATGDYAVITIDRMLPDIDGITVMRQLRDDGIAAPVLIISALGEVDDRVRGLRQESTQLRSKGCAKGRRVGVCRQFPTRQVSLQRSVRSTGAYRIRIRGLSNSRSRRRRLSIARHMASTPCASKCHRRRRQRARRRTQSD